MSDALRLDEIEALMDQARGADEALGDTVPYDFRRPKRVAQEQIRVLHRLHENLVRKLEFSFGTKLRQIANVRLVSVLQLTCEEFLDSLASPTCFSLLNIEGAKSPIAVELSLDLVLAMMDRLLGGPGKPPATMRELTELERTLLRAMLDTVITDYEDVWRPVSELKLAHAGFESNPNQAQFVGPNELVVVVVMKLTFGEVEGTLHIGFPFAGLKPLLGTLSPKNWIADKDEHATKDTWKAIRRHVGLADVRLCAEIRGAKIRVADLLQVQEGDVLPIGVAVEKDVALVVNGVVKFHARPVSRGGHKAVRLTNRSG